MAVTQSDIDTLLAAMATGEQEVQFADGRRVRYRTIADMQQAIGILRGEMSVPMNRSTPISHRRD